MIGRIGRPHGVRGAVHARPSGRTLAEIAVGESVEVRPAGGPPRALTLTSRAGTADGPILTFAGVGTQLGSSCDRLPRRALKSSMRIRDASPTALASSATSASKSVLATMACVSAIISS